MPFDRFLIAPLNSGLETDLKKWQIMDDAFTLLQNAYQFRGRIRKRFGSKWMGTTQASTRLAISRGTNEGSALNLPANTSVHTPQLAVGQTFSLGGDYFYVYQLGNGVATYSTNASVSASINSTSSPNTVTFTGGAASPVFWYPSLPVMGITQYESGAVNNHPSYAFDTEFAYVWNGSWSRSGAAVWHGNFQNFFWTTNWQGVSSDAASQPIMWVTNFNATIGSGAPGTSDDPIWTFDGTTWTAHPGSSTSNGIFFLPAGGAVGAGPFVQTARIIVVFKNRLILLNTVENDNSGGSGTGVANAFVNRARFSWNGSPLAVNAWYEPGQTDGSGNVAQGGDYVDASTEEQIISAEFIKDRLIVYFERSTWELVFLGDFQKPFTFQKINTELGSQSTFSTVPFDKAVLTVGQSGIHACSGSNVERIDNKIPDEIFDAFRTESLATTQTCGIRDYYTEMVYWSFVDIQINPNTQSFPTQVLVYNYKTGTWALNDDCFTAFGYFEQLTDMTWASSFPLTWASFDGDWISNLGDANRRQILAGTPEGFVLIVAPDIARNAPSMQVTNVTIPSTGSGVGFVDLQVINHNLYAEDYDGMPAVVAFENAVGITATQKFYPIYAIIDENNITIADNPTGTQTIVGTYLGGGTLARVSNIQIQSKQWNPYDKEGRNVYLARIDFIVQNTGQYPTGGAITVDYLPSASPVSMIDGGMASGSIMGNSVLETGAYNPSLYPLENYQERLVHPIYFQSSGECIQLDMYFSSALEIDPKNLAASQMLLQNVVWSDFELEALILFTQKTSARLQ
jgi:hypothetical protein